MGIRQVVFHRARPRPDAPKSTMRKRFQREARLVAALMRIKELIDPVMHMRDQGISHSAEYGP